MIDDDLCLALNITLTLRKGWKTTYDEASSNNGEHLHLPVHERYTVATRQAPWNLVKASSCSSYCKCII